MMSPVAALTNSVEAVIVGRVVAGVARGVSLSVIPLYVSEITGRKMLACYQTIITIFIECKWRCLFLLLFWLLLFLLW